GSWRRPRAGSSPSGILRGRSGPSASARRGRAGRGLAMDAVDGNAIAGVLQDVYGRDMTVVTAICASCGDSAAVAECVVYVRAPGSVVRCRSCGNVLAVLVTARGVTCVHLDGTVSAL